MHRSLESELGDVLKNNDNGNDDLVITIYESQASMKLMKLKIYCWIWVFILLHHYCYSKKVKVIDNCNDLMALAGCYNIYMQY